MYLKLTKTNDMKNLETITGKNFNQNINEGYEGTFNVMVGLIDIEVNVSKAVISVMTYKNANSMKYTIENYFTTGQGIEATEKKLNELLTELV